LKVSETFWLTIVGQTQTFSILIAVILFLALPGNKKRAYIEVGMLLIFSLATEVLTWSGILIFHKNMNIVTNVFRLLHLPLVILIYRGQLGWRHRNVVAYTLIAAFDIFAIANFFFIQGPNSINSYASSVTSFCIILMSMTYLFGHEPKSPVESVAKSPMYWINIAFLSYNCAILFIYLWVDYLVNVLNSNLINVWMVHNSLGIIFYAILCYALILIRNQDNNTFSPPTTQHLR
jgi:hypothetical protein